MENLISDTHQQFSVNFSFQVYTVPFWWRLLIFIRKNLWQRVLEANKKQVLLKSYFAESKNWFCQSNLEEQRKSYIKTLDKYTDQKYRLEDSMYIIMSTKQ